jgi:hypothetical protein
MGVSHELYASEHDLAALLAVKELQGPVAGGSDYLSVVWKESSNRTFSSISA